MIERNHTQEQSLEKTIKKIAVLGCGAMAQAMLQAMGREHDGQPPYEIVIRNRTEQSARHVRETMPWLSIAPSLADLLKNADLVIIGMKPGEVEDALKLVKVCLDQHPEITSDTVFLSIIAGKTRADFAALLGSETRVVVSMPTMLVSAAKAPLLVSGQTEDLAVVEQVFNPLGTVLRIEESEMKHYTVFFGCLPGYIDTVIDSLMAAANMTCVGRPAAAALLGQALEAYAVTMNNGNFVTGQLAQSVESPLGVTARMNFALKDARLPAIFKTMYEAGLDWPGWKRIS